MLAMLEPLLALFTDDIEFGLRAIDSRLSHPEPWTRAALWMLRAAMLENEGDMAGLRRDMPIAVEGFRELGDRFGLSQSLTSLAEAHLAFGDSDEAIAALEEAITLLRELDADDAANHERIALANAWIQKGDLSRARTELHALTRETAPTHSVAFAWTALGDIARREGDLDEAARHYEICGAAVVTAPFIAPQFRALHLTATAYLAIERNDPAAADRQLQEATGWSLEASDMPVLARVGVCAATLQAHLGHAADAAKTLGAAARLRGAPDARNPDVALLVERLTTELGGAGYDDAYAQGLGLDRAEAIDQVRRR
jgi:tetratricopeptide (TPR) repeat protein